MKITVWIGLAVLLLLSACSGPGNPGAPTAKTDTKHEAGTGGPASAPSSAPGTANGADDSLFDDVDADEPVKLVVATYYVSEQVQAVVEAYEALHPNVEIELHAASTSGKDLNDVMNKRDQFIQTNNAALLAGGGPDVIELDELPFEQYVKRGLLVDMNGLIEHDSAFDKADYFTNIIEHAQSGDGGLYGMPMYFSLVGLFGDADAIARAGVAIDDANWTLPQFIEIAKQLQETGDYPSVLASEPSYLLRQLITEHYTQLVTESDGNAHFDAEAFAEMMRQVRTMFDEGLLYNVVSNDRASALSAQAGRGRGVNAYFSDTYLYSLQDAIRFAGYPNTKLYAKPHAAGEDSGGYYSAVGTLGINAHSPHPRAAWEFVKFLLDDESVQSYINDHLESSPGFPLNKHVYEQQKQQLMQDGVVKQRGADALEIDRALLEQVDAQLSGASHIVRGPSKLEEIVDSQLEAFFSDQKSAEEAAAIIGNRINLLLNE
ncbi:extracellular solute-binding protein [Paenibacillus sp. IB182496]|uniref:Extracellular solute-binding protein n=1 Tax=Paenibacillus sabuli TaxID=2772509 RepID=A0A927BZC4_9BACL|nr:extracellular solute-binding protein [Paenibacillus sabuli]MBD2848078.1 extracellular solute-binding protein [Paenibacillus sabuli]